MKSEKIILAKMRDQIHNWLLEYFYSGESFNISKDLQDELEYHLDEAFNILEEALKNEERD